MNAEIQPFKSGRLSDVAGIVREMFGYDYEEGLCHILANPLLDDEVSPGDIAYQDGHCVGFQAAIPRRLYWKQNLILGTVGSTLAMLPTASPVLLLHLMKTTVNPRNGSQIFFANTANAISMKMNQLIGVKGQGPSSCEQIRFAILKPGSFLRFATRRHLSRFISDCVDAICGCFQYCKIEKSIACVGDLKIQDIDSFWERYLMTNAGLVSSRTGKELLWAFGDGIRSGRNVMLVWRDTSGIEGYIIARAADDEGIRWRVVDWIAIHDNPSILKALLRSLVRHLRKKSRAGILENIGFNDSVQSILHSYLPWSRRAPNNSFIWKITDCELEKVLLPSFKTDWFWGPYDGDRFMN